MIRSSAACFLVHKLLNLLGCLSLLGGQSLVIIMSEDSQERIRDYPKWIDVKGVEILRFDCHGAPGHWHDRGYDKLGAGGSHVDFPEGMNDSSDQINWSLGQINEKGKQLLEEAGYSIEANSLDSEMVRDATEGIKAHLGNEGNLRLMAIEKGLIEA